MEAHGEVRHTEAPALGSRLMECAWSWKVGGEGSGSNQGEWDAGERWKVMGSCGVGILDLVWVNKLCKREIQYLQRCRGAVIF